MLGYLYNNNWKTTHLCFFLLFCFAFPLELTEGHSKVHLEICNIYTLLKISFSFYVSN